MELCEMTAHELAAKLRNKEITVPEIISSVYKRIEQIYYCLYSFPMNHPIDL